MIPPFPLCYRGGVFLPMNRAQQVRCATVHPPVLSEPSVSHERGGFIKRRHQTLSVTLYASTQLGLHY